MESKMDMINDTEDKINAQRQQEIDKTGDIFGEQEEILWHIDLGKNLRIGKQ